MLTYDIAYIEYNPDHHACRARPGNVAGDVPNRGRCVTTTHYTVRRQDPLDEPPITKTGRPWDRWAVPRAHVLVRVRARLLTVAVQRVLYSVAPFPPYLAALTSPAPILTLFPTRPKS